MDIGVFDKVDLPYFQFEPVPPNYLLSTGEDVYFFRKCIKAGLDVWVDHDLSQQVKHIGDFEYDNRYAYVTQQTKQELYDAIPTGLE